MTLHSPQWGEIERIWLLRGRNNHDHLTTKTRNGTGRGAVLLAVMMLVTITLSGRMQQHLGERAASRSTSRRCGTAPVGKPGAERAQSEPEK